MHRFVLHNDDILDSREKTIRAGQVGFLNGWGVFSTIRIADGVLFAYERHWLRMKHDAERMHVPFPADSEQLKSALLQLAEANRAHNATLRVAVVRNRGGLFEAPDQTRDFDIVAFTSDINPWGDSVRLAVKANARYAGNEFAGAKITSWAQNLTWYEEAHDRGFDEMLLLNERGEVSECTSANIFAALGGEVATPPLDSGCLPGVSREVLLCEIHVPGVRIVEKALLLEDLNRADQVFITSTTRDLLPVSFIDGLKVKNGALAVVEKLATAFAEYRHSYVRQSAAKKLDRITV